MRALPLALLLALASGGVAAQPVPEDAKLVRLTFTGRGFVLVGDARHRLAASAQIRDAKNRIVLPASLRGGYAARVIVDRNGDPWRVWLVKPVRESTEPFTP